VSKRFDVGEFEQDLRNVHNAYRRLDDKISQQQALKAQSSQAEGFSRPNYELS